MYNVRKEVHANLGHFRMDDYCFRYSDFVPRLYNWCLQLGFEAGKIMPSRAFCSDESQGYPVILMTKHFGVFPFNHGRVGGIMANGRHGPHAHHGKDLLIVQASHVGYDPQTYSFGTFKRPQTEHSQCSSTCGKIHSTISWYLCEYKYAQQHVYIDMRDKQCFVTIDNKYLSQSYDDTLVLDLRHMIEHHTDGTIIPLATHSTSRTFKATKNFQKQMQWFFDSNEGPQPIADALLPENFSFQKSLPDNIGDSQQLEYNLLCAMPWIVTSAEPMLTAAQANTQAEFDRSYRIISQQPEYQGRNLIYLTGLHVDISPMEGQHFILNKFIPWAAYVQLRQGEKYILEQDQLFKQLNLCEKDNPHQLDFDQAIQVMENCDPVFLKLPY